MKLSVPGETQKSWEDAGVVYIWVYRNGTFLFILYISSTFSSLHLSLLSSTDSSSSHQIITALEEDPTAQKMQLGYRLQQIAAAVENKVTDLWQRRRPLVWQQTEWGGGGVGGTIRKPAVCRLNWEAGEQRTNEWGAFRCFFNLKKLFFRSEDFSWH